MAEVWYRNCANYVREIIECNENKIILDYGYTIKRKIKPVQWADLYFGTNPYRLIHCGVQGSAEYRNGSTEPVAVYPTWEYGQDEGILEGYCQENVGDDSSLTDDLTTDILERPVAGQEHRVLVINFPDAGKGPGKQALRLFRDLQEEYPQAMLHVHGLSYFSTAVRLGFKAFDFEARTTAASGRYLLPNGRALKKEDHREPHKHWINLLGFKTVDLNEPRNRCMFNIKAARWAAEHSLKEPKIITTARQATKGDVDITSSDAEYSPEENSRIFFGKMPDIQPGDKYVCNSCSLATACKYYREGAVCSVPNSEPKELAAYFRTRDSGTIIDGMSAIMQISASRLEKGLEQEEDFGLDPEVTKIADRLFQQAEKLAKLVDPTLRNPKVGVQVNVGAGGTTTSVEGPADPRQFIKQAVRELEMNGFSREQITPAMIEGVLTRATTPPRVIEGNTGADTVVPLSELPF